ncbi:hypothetical protein PAHAL_2G219300 [Panicum hallii]|uniref:Uncharacterized protein n=1 Tax=Panicum hallii TaxID=206008 RepID=A0A2T8KPX8_9POAL|nr:hypothetical protein PAHAL_2G219300 [Panicum hallii]
MDGHLILSAARRTVLNHGALLLSTHQGSIHDHITMHKKSWSMHLDSEVSPLRHKSVDCMWGVGKHGEREEAAAEGEAAEGAEGAEGQALHHPPMRRHAPLLE